MKTTHTTRTSTTRRALLAATFFILHSTFFIGHGTAAAPKPPPGAPNAGWKQWNQEMKYKLQNWTLMPDSAVLTVTSTNGTTEYTTKLVSGSWASTQTKPRVEIAWPRWPDQKSENMISADVMYEKGTRGATCIMQIKTNDNTGGSGAEAVYLNVRDDNALHHGVSRQVIIDDNGYNVWHNIKAAYNPLTGRARVWVDNVLKFEQTYYDGGIDAQWYFKTGCYHVKSGQTAIAHFKNITFWVNPVKPTKEEIKAAQDALAEKAKNAKPKKKK